MKNMTNKRLQPTGKNVGLFRKPEMKAIRVTLTIFIAFGASPCMAEYVAIGPYEGEVCSGFVINKCSLERLDAVKRDGKFYKINKVWNGVDDYKGGRCVISFSAGEFGFLDSTPDFYQYDENRVLRAVDVDSYITFKCRKR